MDARRRTWVVFDMLDTSTSACSQKKTPTPEFGAPPLSGHANFVLFSVSFVIVILRTRRVHRAANDLSPCAALASMASNPLFSALPSPSPPDQLPQGFMGCMARQLKKLTAGSVCCIASTPTGWEEVQPKLLPSARRMCRFAVTPQRTCRPSRRGSHIKGTAKVSETRASSKGSSFECRKRTLQ